MLSERELLRLREERETERERVCVCVKEGERETERERERVSRVFTSCNLHWLRVTRSSPRWGLWAEERAIYARSLTVSSYLRSVGM